MRAEGKNKQKSTKKNNGYNLKCGNSINLFLKLIMISELDILSTIYTQS